MSYTIRNLKNYNEMLAIPKLQQEIWGLNEENIGLYPPMLNMAAKSGGVVLGAFDNNTGKMVAFLFGFLGREPGGPLKLCSQTMGVHKEWRGQGIAEALKNRQREQSIAQGLPLITWTYDPLEAPNAHLNLRKLRAVSRTYWRDVYGSNFGALNAGLPTDRLLVEWWMNGNPLNAKPPPDGKSADLPSVFEIEGAGVKRQIIQSYLTLNATKLALEVLADLHLLKAANMALALDWRLKVREAFEAYFERGYIAVDFISTVGKNGGRRNRYVLQKGTPELLAEIGILELE